MKSYTKPSMTVIRLQADIVCTSGEVVEPPACSGITDPVQYQECVNNGGLMG